MTVEGDPLAGEYEPVPVSVDSYIVGAEETPSPLDSTSLCVVLKWAGAGWIVSVPGRQQWDHHVPIPRDEPPLVHASRLVLHLRRIHRAERSVAEEEGHLKKIIFGMPQ